MNELISFLKNNNIKYILNNYDFDDDCVVIQKDKYILYICYDNGFLYSLQSNPYTLGEMFPCTLSDIFYYLSYYLKITVKETVQLTLF